MTARRIPILGGAHAVILHRPHDVVDALARQLTAIGLTAEQVWPQVPATAVRADFLFFDADMGFDEQFPWKPGAAPMPTIALIGSEAPGRIEWALSHAANAQLLKPVGSAGERQRLDGGIEVAVFLAQPLDLILDRLPLVFAQTLRHVPRFRLARRVLGL